MSTLGKWLEVHQEERVWENVFLENFAIQKFWNGFYSNFGGFIAQVGQLLVYWQTLNMHDHARPATKVLCLTP